MSRALVCGMVVAAAALAGCASPAPWGPAAPGAQRPAAASSGETQTRVVRVYVPRPIKCVPETLGPPPTYPDSDAALRDAGGAADRYQLLAAGRILREERLQRLEEIVRRCRAAAR